MPYRGCGFDAEFVSARARELAMTGSMLDRGCGPEQVR